MRGAAVARLAAKPKRRLADAPTDTLRSGHASDRAFPEGADIIKLAAKRPSQGGQAIRRKQKTDPPNNLAKRQSRPDAKTTQKNHQCHTRNPTSWCS